MAEIRIAPDGQSVAIRSEQPDETEWNAWGVMHRRHGGAWATSSQVQTWVTLDVPQTTE